MIQLSQVELMRGGKWLLKDASTTIYPQHKVALIGANGTGKSSLFALLRGELSADNGHVDVPSHWVIASVKQETPALDCSALDYVLQGDAEFWQLRVQQLAAEASHDGAQLAHVHQRLEEINGYGITAKAGELLFGLGFSAEQVSQPVKAFSGGWRMRLNLAQALLCRSDLLLLDEPTNHLDLDAVYWLEEFLKAYEGTLLLISHDRDFIDAVVGSVVHISQQQLTTYKGGYSAFELQKAEKLAQQQVQYDKQQRQIAHLESFINRFKAKATKAKQAQSRIKALERMEMVAAAHVDSPFEFSFRTPTSNPNPLLSLDQVQAGYGDKIILKSVKLNLVPGARIALLGRNGAGKSTLIKLLAGELSAKAGEVHLSTGVRLGYFAQHQLETLDDEASPLLHLQRLDPNAREQTLRDFLGGFGFIGDQALATVAPFSGGEKARLVLAMLVYQNPNLLLLDEPTNHLDLEMRHALTVALQDFAGAVVMVSHDRHLLKTVADDFYLVDNGQVSRFDDDLEAYHQWLTSQSKMNKAEANRQNDQATGNTQKDRKDQKRREADFRKLTQNARKQAEKLEQQVDKLSSQLSEIEGLLADNSLYEDANKLRLKELLAKQTQHTQQLAEVEMQWLETLEQLELMQQQFDAGELCP